MVMWTVQAPVVYETLTDSGIYCVKKEFIRKKYGVAAPVFETAYNFFTSEAAKRIPKPDEAESPVWLFRDRRMVHISPGSFLIKLEIPDEEMLLFDLRDWQKILSLGPLGDEKETHEICEEVKRQGAADPSDVFLKPFYPVLKQKIRGTWRRLFERTDIEPVYQQGAVWCLRRAWILEAQCV